MSLNQLAQKIVLASKTSTVLAVNKARVLLQWKDDADLDLAAFGRTISGQNFSVISDNYPKGSMGNLNQFPFMQLSGDAGVGGNVAGDMEEEELLITNLDQVQELYIACFCCDAAGVLEQNAKFSTLGAQVVVNTDAGDEYTMPLQAVDSNGLVAVIAKLERVNGKMNLVNNSEVLNVQEFFAKIPAADVLTA
jgi:uncharacterized protein involved in tellurium resistance